MTVDRQHAPADSNHSGERGLVLLGLRRNDVTFAAFLGWQRYTSGLGVTRLGLIVPIIPHVLLLLVLVFVRQGVSSGSLMQNFEYVLDGYVIFALFAGIATGSMQPVLLAFGMDGFRQRPIAWIALVAAVEKGAPIILMYTGLSCISQLETTWSVSYVLLGIFSILAALAFSTAVGILLAIVAARWRLLRPIIEQGVRSLLFLSPILWQLEGSQAGWRSTVALLNPLTWFMQGLRGYTTLEGTSVPLTMGVLVLIVSAAAILASRLVTNKVALWALR